MDALSKIYKMMWTKDQEPSINVLGRTREQRNSRALWAHQKAQEIVKEVLRDQTEQAAEMVPHKAMPLDKQQRHWRKARLMDVAGAA